MGFISLKCCFCLPLDFINHDGLEEKNKSSKICSVASLHLTRSFPVKASTEFTTKVKSSVNSQEKAKPHHSEGNAKDKG